MHKLISRGFSICKHNVMNQNVTCKKTYFLTPRIHLSEYSAVVNAFSHVQKARIQNLYKYIHLPGAIHEVLIIVTSYEFTMIFEFDFFQFTC